jgi:NAD(P)-dependent dehydrogenase (short-subunit alcohol dehydrogenase family)
VVLHARNSERASSLGELVGRAQGVVVGDLASADETRGVADQVNAIGGIDVVIHNAAIYLDPQRVATADGHARTLAVYVLAPYPLTAWVKGPSGLVYLSSGMHADGDASLQCIDWRARSWNGVQAYCDSKLFITALAFALRDGCRMCMPTQWTLDGCRPEWGVLVQRTTWHCAISPRHGRRPARITRRPRAEATGPC